jgi:hypothetical protein
MRFRIPQTPFRLFQTPKLMSIQSDRWIRRMAEEEGMIEPFHPCQVRAGTISYGLSSFGYDIRVASEFKVSPPRIS